MAPTPRRQNHLANDGFDADGEGVAVVNARDNLESVQTKTMRQLLRAGANQNNACVMPSFVCTSLLRISRSRRWNAHKLPL